MAAVLEPVEAGFLLDQLAAIDARVDAAEGEGIRERWLFGRRILEEYGYGQLPHGLTKTLEQRTSKSGREIRYRIQFARLARTDTELGNAIAKFGSWYGLTSQGLPSGLDVHTSSETSEWSTPQDLFDLLDAEFHFNLDVCATRGNAKCRDYFTEEDDGLAQDWRGVCWMNPPYGRDIGAWMNKAFVSSHCVPYPTVVCLLPARTDTDWWWNFARHGEVRFLHGRLRFGDAASGAPFPSAIVIFDREPCVKWWEEWPTA